MKRDVSRDTAMLGDSHALPLNMDVGQMVQDMVVDYQSDLDVETGDWPDAASDHPVGVTIAETPTDSPATSTDSQAAGTCPQDGTFQLSPTQNLALNALRNADRDQLKHILYSCAPAPIGHIAGEFDAELLDQGNGVMYRLVWQAFQMYGPWTGKAFHPISETKGVGYNTFQVDGQSVARFPMDTSIESSAINGRPAMKIDYRNRNRGLITLLDGEVREVYPSIWLGMGIFGPRIGRKWPLRRKIMFMMIGPKRPYRNDAPTS